jgi:UDP-N-acetylglucosamine/UDP-N-acetylgalactosamine diphosphorylase
MATGRVLMSSPSEIATNPDGHGGSITALHKSGAIADMKRRGVTTLSYFQVDNATVRVIDPVFIGLHASPAHSSAEMSSKMIPKAYPEEKLGLFCSSRGRTEVIEYSDLPMDLQRERLADGSLRFLAGSIAVHVMGVTFIERLATDPAFSLPFHRAEKKVPCADPATGVRIDPAAPNGIKLERFVFDALPLCRNSIVYETEEFAPIKNASGVDSPESCTKLQTLRAARWLTSVGVKIPRNDAGEPDCTLEISASTALEPSDLLSARLPASIARGSSLLL